MVITVYQPKSWNHHEAFKDNFLPLKHALVLKSIHANTAPLYFTNLLIYTQCQVIKNTAQAPTSDFLQDFTAHNPSESVLIKNAQLTPYFSFSTIKQSCWLVFQTQTITSTPKTRSRAKLLRSTSETLATKAKIDQTEILEPAPASCGFYLSHWTFFFSSLHFGEGREGCGRKGRDKIFTGRTQMELQNLETQEDLPNISWEHKTCTFHIFVQQLFYVRIALWNFPWCWLPEAFTAVLENTRSLLSCTIASKMSTWGSTGSSHHLQSIPS